MKLKVSPTSVLSGEVIVPGSKSHSIRAVAVASLADGISEIGYPLYSEDTLSAKHTAKMLGAEVLEQTPEVWRIRGTHGSFKSPREIINVGNSGTTLRIFTALAALANFEVTFDGDESLRTRVMKPLLDALADLGAKETSQNQKCPLTICGPIHGGKITMECVSSQFLTAVLFAAPLIDTDYTEIKLTLLNEKPYVQITLDWLDSQGIVYEKSDDFMYFKIPGRQSYKPFKRTIPADFSTATFPLVASMIMGCPLTVKNLDFTDSQGDKAVFRFASEMGATLIVDGDQTTILPPKGKPRAIPVLDLNDTPDALPALAVLACFCEGTTQIVNTAQARLKETDRIACMTAELKKMGVDITETPDGMIISPPEQLTATTLCGYGDHRIVMALALAALRANGDSMISTAEAAMVTYPNFVQDFIKLGANFTLLAD